MRSGPAEHRRWPAVSYTTSRGTTSTFAWPPIEAGRIRLSVTQLALLMEGLEWRKAEPRPVRRSFRVA